MPLQDDLLLSKSAGDRRLETPVIIALAPGVWVIKYRNITQIGHWKGQRVHLQITYPR